MKVSFHFVSALASIENEECAGMITVLATFCATSTYTRSAGSEGLDKFVIAFCTSMSL